MSAEEIPDTIVSGSTLYVRQHEGHRDYYYPAHQVGDKSVAWCLSWDKERNIPYFFHKQSRETVWTLPDINAVSTDAQDSAVESIGAREKTNRSPAAEDLSEESVTDRRKLIQQQLRARVREKFQHHSTPDIPTTLPPMYTASPVKEEATVTSMPSTATATSVQPVSTVVGTQPQPAVANNIPEPLTSAGMSSTTANPSVSEEAPPPSSTARSRAHSIKERLAQRRARSGSGSSTPFKSSETDSPKVSAEAQPATFSTPTAAPKEEKKQDYSQTPQEPSPSPEVRGATAGSAAADKKNSEQRDTQSQNVTAQQQQQQRTPFEQQMFEEGKRQIVEADERLQRERAEILRNERLLTERAKLLQAERQRHEEHLLQVVEKRRQMEERRLELEQRRAEALRQKVTQQELDRLGKDDPLQRQETFTSLEGSVHATAEEYFQKVRYEATKKHREAVDQFTSSMIASLESCQKNTIEDDEVIKSMEPDENEEEKVTSPGASAEISYDKNHTYTGSVGKGGQVRHGKGHYAYDANGSSYFDGNWSHDRKSGPGVFSSPHFQHDGFWEDDVPHGAGVLQTKNMKANGLFRQGKGHGKWIAQLRGGETFMGRLQRGKVAGTGSIHMPTQDRVEWKWADPQQPGSGEVVIEFANGDFYAGSVKDYQLHGKGHFRHHEGHEYTGDFFQGVMHGEGTYSFANGNVFQGQLQHGQFHGKGVYTSGDQWTYDGDWNKGKMHGQATVKYKNGDVWKGLFEHDRKLRGKYVLSELYQLVF